MTLLRSLILGAFMVSFLGGVAMSQAGPLDAGLVPVSLTDAPTAALDAPPSAEEPAGETFVERATAPDMIVMLIVAVGLVLFGLWRWRHDQTRAWRHVQH